MIKTGNSPMIEANNPLASQVKKGDWVVVDLNPKVAGLVQLIPVKVSLVNGHMFRGWAWNEREHEYSCSQIRFIGNSEKSTDNFIMDNERKSSKELKDSIMNESSSDKDFEDFKKRCQANPTYKKAETIANKYGYRLAPLCYVEVTKSGKKLVSFNVAVIDRKSYHPEIYFSSKFGKDPELKIQTTAYGSMNLIEHSKFIKAVTDAHKMVSELSKLDLTTLETTEMEG